ncbi:hypothetical protein DL240_00015 [Lujinxingia litoralis]|uniref:Calcineurin-like phosphoesterase domain-containing protein n=1 Tax=Lujinxingia litoralis TaxID=2211119 RepID=A0A328CDC5_9DELT|nr:metallophosphoesterase [Lujinxingia litoralis]RAL24633.1 hypothetical protein DL240_00015 [Lujinxingia litoralis]
MRRELILAAATLGGLLLAVPVMGGTPVRPPGAAPVPTSGAADADTPGDAPAPASPHAQAPPAADASREQEWTVAVISDLNASYGSTEYGKEVHAAVNWLTEVARPDLVISPGDLVAGQRQGLDHGAMWQAFHQALTRPLARAHIPFAISPGNHDASGSPAFWEERVEFARQWQDRRPQVSFVDDRNYPFHYAFEMGPALFISLDATTVGPLDEAQRHWLEGILKASDDYPVKIVFGHLPLHPVAVEKAEESLGDEALEGLLRRYEVDLYVAGHHHAYYPGKRGGLGLLHSACLGSGPRTLIGDDRLSDRSVALVRFGHDGVRQVDAYRGEHFDEVVPRQELPRSVGQGSRRIWRDDVAPEMEAGEARRNGAATSLEGGA